MGKLFGEKKPSFFDGKQLSIGIVIVKSSFNIEKDEPGFAVAHVKIKGRVRMEFFDRELTETGSTQGSRRLAVFCGTSVMEPVSAARNRSLKQEW